MGFEPHQPHSKVEAVNEFTDRMKATLEEARSALTKSKDEMVRYYTLAIRFSLMQATFTPPAHPENSLTGGLVLIQLNAGLVLMPTTSHCPLP